MPKNEIDLIRRHKWAQDLGRLHPTMYNCLAFGQPPAAVITPAKRDLDPTHDRTRYGRIIGGSKAILRYPEFRPSSWILVERLALVVILQWRLGVLGIVIYDG